MNERNQRTINERRRAHRRCSDNREGPSPRNAARRRERRSGLRRGRDVARLFRREDRYKPGAGGASAEGGAIGGCFIPLMPLCKGPSFTVKSDGTVKRLAAGSVRWMFVRE